MKKVFATVAIVIASALAFSGCSATATSERTSSVSDLTDALNDALNGISTTDATDTLNDLTGDNTASGSAPLATIDGLNIADYPYRESSYQRAAFGAAWADVDSNGCDTRNDILTRDLTGANVASDCKVLSGTLTDKYTGNTVAFMRGAKTSAEVPIDHIFSLSDAWSAGAKNWTDTKRTQFANDPDNLTATTAEFNTWKSDKAPQAVLQRNFTGECFYATQFIKVAKKYDLSVRPADANALTSALTTCK